MAHITCKQCLMLKHENCSFEICHCKEIGHPDNIMEILEREI